MEVKSTKFARFGEHMVTRFFQLCLRRPTLHMLNRLRYFSCLYVAWSDICSLVSANLRSLVLSVVFASLAPLYTCPTDSATSLVYNVWGALLHGRIFRLLNYVLVTFKDIKNRVRAARTCSSIQIGPHHLDNLKSCTWLVLYSEL